MHCVVTLVMLLPKANTRSADEVLFVSHSRINHSAEDIGHQVRASHKERRNKHHGLHYLEIAVSYGLKQQTTHSWPCKHHLCHNGAPQETAELTEMVFAWPGMGRLLLNCTPTIVSTGPIAFLKACLNRTIEGPSPLALAVLM